MARKSTAATRAGAAALIELDGNLEAAKAHIFGLAQIIFATASDQPGRDAMLHEIALALDSSLQELERSPLPR